MKEQDLQRVFQHQRVILGKLTTPGLNRATREGLQGHLDRLKEKAEELIGGMPDWKGDLAWLREQHRRAVRKLRVARVEGDSYAQQDAERWLERVEAEIASLEVTMAQSDQVLAGKVTPEEEEEAEYQGFVDEVEEMFAAEARETARQEAAEAKRDDDKWERIYERQAGQSDV